MQRDLLRGEDVKVTDKLNIDIEKYRYRPDPGELKKLELDDKYIDEVMEKFGF